MTAQILSGGEVATARSALSITELVEEYEAKLAAIPAAMSAFDDATKALKSAATLRGTWGDVSIDPRAPYESTLRDSLLKSSWRHVYAVGGFDRIAGDGAKWSGQRVLEPSCGCGRFLDALRAAGASVLGCEIDPVRGGLCEAKGHSVMRMNFLDTVPEPLFDAVVMNPPFYGRHYAKHVRHALGFVKPGGTLTSILPASARYDHGELDDLSPRWDDLPVGSFAESGTNINTTIATIRRAAA